jgi:hypothetical protein
MALNTSLSSLNWLTQLNKDASPMQPDLAEGLKEESATSDEDDILDVDWASDASLKPPFAYATLCYMALNETDKSKLELNEIYDYITTNFAYYRTAEPGWKVSFLVFRLAHLRAQACFFRILSDTT